MKYKIILAASLLLTILIACNQHRENKVAADISQQELNKSSDSYKESPMADSAAKPQYITDKKDGRPDPVKQPSANPDWDKKIIKNASLELEVKDGNTFYKNLREQVKNLGGYVAQEEQTETEYKLENSLVIKVPVDQFDNAVALLSDKVEKIHQRKISSDDVTGEIVDTRSRMEAKKQVRLRYMELLNQAKNMEDILNVQSEINQIQEEIESAAGRVNYLGHAAAFSTINLTYFQVLNEKAVEDKSPSFLNRVGSAFKAGGQWITELFIGLVAIWPLIVVALVAVLVIRKYKGRKSGKVTL